VGLKRPPPFSRLLKPNAFPPEPPTQQIPRTPAQRAAKLVSDWNRCSPRHQDAIEKLAARFAKLAPRKKS